MSNVSVPAHPSPLARVLRRFERWRRTRHRRSPIPDALWVLALDAARVHGLHQTARTLRLNHTALKQRLHAGRPRGRRARPRPVRRAAAGAGCRGPGLHPRVGNGAGGQAADPPPGDRPAGPRGPQPHALARCAMIQVTPQLRILVAVDPTDFRKGIDGLARVCQDGARGRPLLRRPVRLPQPPRHRAQAPRVRLVRGSGCARSGCRLAGSASGQPAATGPARRLEAHELQVLLAAGNPATAQAAPAWRRVSPAA